LFASKAVNANGADGLFFGNPKQLLIQLIAVGITIIFTSLATIIIYKIVDFLVGVRVDEKSELMGLDLTQHHERAYTVLE